MPDTGFDLSKWPPVLQLLAYLGAFVAGALMWILGTRKKDKPPDDTHGLELIEARLRLDIQQIEARLRLDVQQIMQANREAFFVEMRRRGDAIQDDTDKLQQRLGHLETAIALLQQHGRRGR